ncbi:MAG: SIR2 family protein [Candidatus Sericytochromatia bacterium]
MEKSHFTEHYNYKHLIKNFDLIKNGRGLILFIGAGLSTPLFPRWGEFINKLLTSAIDTCKLNEDEVKQLRMRVDRGADYLFVAQKCIEILGPLAYREHLRECFDKNFNEEQIPENYKKVFQLPSNLIITTNYDLIPEKLSKGNHRIYSRANASEALASFSVGEKVILKMHGDILSQSSIILTSDDFTTAIFNDSAINDFLTNVLSTKTLLFLGFSLTDPHIEMLLNLVKSKHGSLLYPHYALMPNVDSIDVEKLEKNFNVKTIPFTPVDRTFSEIGLFTDNLVSLVSNTTNQTPINIIDDQVQLCDRIHEILSSSVITRVYSFNIDTHNKFLDICFASRAETGSEYQNELLYLLRNIDFRSNLVENISITTFHVSDENKSHVEFEKMRHKLNLKFKIIENFRNNLISNEDFWSEIVFFRLEAVGTMNMKFEEVKVPYVKY